MADAWGPFALAMILPYPVPTIEGHFMRPQLKTWYKNLKRAPWNPPNFVFPIVWYTLYGLMGYSSYLVWREGELSSSPEVHEKVRCALGLYAFQLALNYMWTPIFFNFHKIGLSMINLLATVVAVWYTISEFYAINHLAGTLLIPYLSWGLFASTLNLYVWLYNRSKTSEKTN